MSALLRSMGHLPEALETIEPGLARFPDDRRIVAEAAQVMQQWGRWEEAAGYWRRIIHRPGASRSWLRPYSSALLALGRFDELEAFLAGLRRRNYARKDIVGMEALLAGAPPVPACAFRASGA